MVKSSSSCSGVRVCSWQSDKSDQLVHNYSRLEAAISRRQQLLDRLEVLVINSLTFVIKGSSVAEWLACWTQAQKGLNSNRSRDAVG